MFQFSVSSSPRITDLSLRALLLSGSYVAVCKPGQCSTSVCNLLWAKSHTPVIVGGSAGRASKIYSDRYIPKCILETPKNTLSKALEMGVCFYRGPTFGEHGGTLLS